ncbi:MAG: hypothetical protein ACLSA6_15015 [Holdemania massiliensis]
MLGIALFREICYNETSLIFMTGGISHDSLLSATNKIQHPSPPIARSSNFCEPATDKARLGPEPDSETVRIPDSHLVPAVILVWESDGRSRPCDEDRPEEMNRIQETLKTVIFQ